MTSRIGSILWLRDRRDPRPNCYLSKIQLRVLNTNDLSAIRLRSSFLQFVPNNLPPTGAGSDII
jgi:hypothetical protein